MHEVKLTQYSHGAGCGCKISPKVLDSILKSSLVAPADKRLLVGNQTRDDAAVYDIGNEQAIISTTDFFMPIVDDPFDFGRIAAANAISDIYAMGGRPIMAIAILGWPLDKLSAEIAQQVVEGGRSVCIEAGIQLAGGHSIDAPEPVFGLAVTGIVDKSQLKKNNTAEAGCKLYLTKPLGTGILATAQKKKKLKAVHQDIAKDSMCRLNTIGAEVARLPEVKALTDVTGFGLMGHLAEMCEASDVNAVVDFASVPQLDGVAEYMLLDCVPGGTQRNFDSYGHKIAPFTDEQKNLLCDPQTSGGLLVAVEAQAESEFEALLQKHDIQVHPIGYLLERHSDFYIQVI
ncbi:MAG: selenide, water dikinase SelD [Proteobacteria bacterium]|nr:selenide, water dikinase SelD [Pseudomonadota bacterium]